MFPVHRPRRLRASPGLRRLVRETRLSPEQLVLPLFVGHGEGVRRPIDAMPGQQRLSVDTLLEEAREARSLGLGGVILFGIPRSKDELGSEAYADDGVIARSLKALRQEVPELVLIADICLCEYTSHGHCGVIEGERVLNDPTLELLSRAAVTAARAGAHIVAPSDMMDGRVAAIREALDTAELDEVAIMSYAAKFASSFYGPFRDAADSTPSFGDRRSYQMDPANAREALREVALDIEEGADIVMVKPALPALDIVAAVHQDFDLPVAAYQVSGEYSQILAAAERGWIDGDAVMLESLLSIRRAGADIILSYFAKHAARLLGA